MARVEDRDEARLQRARDLAWAEAFGGLSRVAATLSSRLREMHSGDGESGAAAAAAEDRAAVERPSIARLPRGGFGPRQTAVLALGGLDTPEGLSATEIGTTLGLEVANTHTVMRGLERLELLTRVPDAKPIRWQRVPT